MPSAEERAKQIGVLDEDFLEGAEAAEAVNKLLREGWSFNGPVQVVVGPFPDVHGKVKIVYVRELIRKGKEKVG